MSVDVVPASCPRQLFPRTPADVRERERGPGVSSSLAQLLQCPCAGEHFSPERRPQPMGCEVLARSRCCHGSAAEPDEGHAGAGGGRVCLRLGKPGVFKRAWSRWREQALVRPPPVFDPWPCPEPLDRHGSQSRAALGAMVMCPTQRTPQTPCPTQCAMDSQPPLSVYNPNPNPQTPCPTQCTMDSQPCSRLPEGGGALISLFHLLLLQLR